MEIAQSTSDQDCYPIIRSWITEEWVLLTLGIALLLYAPVIWLLTNDLPDQMTSAISIPTAIILLGCGGVMVLGVQVKRGLRHDNLRQDWKSCFDRKHPHFKSNFLDILILEVHVKEYAYDKPHSSWPIVYATAAKIEGGTADDSWLGQVITHALTTYRKGPSKASPS